MANDDNSKDDLHYDPKDSSVESSIGGAAARRRRDGSGRSLWQQRATAFEVFPRRPETIKLATSILRRSNIHYKCL